MKVAQVQGESHPKRPQSHPELDHLWGLLISHVGTPFCVSHVRGAAVSSPYAYRILRLSGRTEGQALPQGPGPLQWGAVGEHVLGVPALPPATPPSTAPEVQAPPLL